MFLTFTDLHLYLILTERMANWIGLSALAVWATLPSYNALAAGSSAILYTYALFYKVAGSFQNKLE